MAIFVEVTTPTFSCRRRAGALAFSIGLQLPLAQQRFHPRQITARFAQPLQTLGLAGIELEAQPENLLGQLAFLQLQFLGVHFRELLDAARRHYSTSAR
ncbi:MAG TPA: hypothetical protein VGA40_00585, partial [Candidatus Acidoferrales bacterium]